MSLDVAEFSRPYPSIVQGGADHGLLGRTVELIVKDSAGSSEKAVSFAKQLIDEDKVVAVIGPSTSGETMAIKDIFQEAGVVLVSCAAADPIVDHNACG